MQAMESKEHSVIAKRKTPVQAQQEFFLFLSCILHTSLVNIIKIIGNKKAFIIYKGL